MAAPSDSPAPTDAPEDLPSFGDLVKAELAADAGMRSKRLARSLIPAADLEQLLPRFKQFEFLGAGGMGVVYKAWQTDLRRWVAVKILATDLAQDLRALERFRNEASILAQLRHPNIVPIHEFGSDGDLAFLVMDYVEGRSLKTWARQQKPTASETAVMMARIARAVGVAHASGITHRDLKPSNILVTAEDLPVLIDFGLAQHAAWQQTTRFTQPGELAGTVAYLAPEQVNDALGEVSPATDVHACGVMTFEILAGGLPRQGVASQVIARLHHEEFPPRLRGVALHAPQDLEAICWKAMQRDPRDRYATGSALADDFERFAEGRPIQAKRPALFRMAWQGVRRRPDAAAALAVCMVAIAFAGWNGRQAAIDQHKSRLIAQLNRSLTSSRWTPALFKEADALLNQFDPLLPLYARHLREDMLNRTAAEVRRYLQLPEPTAEELTMAQQLIALLEAGGSEEALGLKAAWQARQRSWQTLVELRAPITADAATKVFPAADWVLEGGQLRFNNSWTPVDGRTEVRPQAIFDLELEGEWRRASSAGIVLRFRTAPDLGFYVFNPSRFEKYLPGFRNKDKMPVMAIVRHGEPLAYAILPAEIAAASRLKISARCIGDELAMEVNDSASVAFSSFFVRSLPSSSMSLLLPLEVRLRRLAIRHRDAEPGVVPFSAADEMVAAGNAHAALAVYEQYVKRPDTGIEARYKRGYCLNAVGRLNEALEDWKVIAGYDREPWRSLACYQLWLASIAGQNSSEADAWFDLLIGKPVPRSVRLGVRAADRQGIEQAYLPIMRSLKFLTIYSTDLEALERAVAVQEFLGTNPRQIAAQTGLAFHFAGQDQRSRQMFANAIAQMVPNSTRDAADLALVLNCLDQWASLGNADQDAVLQPTLSAWELAAGVSDQPGRAVPQLEKARRMLRQTAALSEPMRETLDGVASDGAVAARLRAEARLLVGCAHQLAHQPDQASLAWRAAVDAMGVGAGHDDTTIQTLITQMVARGLAHSWNKQEASDWMAAMLGKSKPAGSGSGWVGSLIQTLAGTSLPDVLNVMLTPERGQRFALDYCLRKRAARELAQEGSALFYEAMLRQGTSLPPDDPRPRAAAEQIAAAFSAGQLDALALGQFFKVWGGTKNFVTWNLLANRWSPEMRQTISAIMEERYIVLGNLEAATEFKVEMIGGDSE